jgi:hypothetical protein
MGGRKMNCKWNDCKSPAVEGGEYCNVHRWPEVGHDPIATHTSANTDQAPQRQVAAQPIPAAKQETRIATNTEDE